MLRTILWKELLDLSRDKKTLAAVVILPLLGLPGLALIAGSLASTQHVYISITIEESSAQEIAEQLAELMRDYITRQGYKPNITITTQKVSPAYYDLLIIIPEGFMKNLSRLDGVAVLRVSSGLGTGGNIASQALNAAVSYLSHQIVIHRVEELSKIAGVSIEAPAFLSPISIHRTYHEATGAPATQQQAQIAFTARLLEFAFLFVVNPAIVYMADSIVGERERKTIEKLLMSPINRRDILTGKIIASFILGFAASLVDALGILLFFILSGLQITLTLGLSLVWAISAALIILVTSAMVAIVSARSESIRSAQNASFIILAAAMAIYFAALLVDLSRIPKSVSMILQAIPFTHAALAVHTYSIGEPNGPLLHLSILSLFLVLFLYIAVKSFNSEKILLHR